MSTRNKKFRPPLKSLTPASPALDLAPSSNAQNPPDLCLSDSPPATQTHTVLSYCDNYQEGLSTKSPESPRSDSPSIFSEDSSPLTTDSESEPEASPSRFRVHRPAALPGYGYNILHHKKRTVADFDRGVGRNKRVRIVTPEVRRVGGGRDLSVYDYQPTPPENVGVAKERGRRGRLDVSGYCSTTEEQVTRVVVYSIAPCKLPTIPQFYLFCGGGAIFFCRFFSL